MVLMIQYLFTLMLGMRLVTSRLGVLLRYMIATMLFALGVIEVRNCGRMYDECGSD